jgi:glucose dehydrogenase
MSHDLLQL